MAQKHLAKRKVLTKKNRAVQQRAEKRKKELKLKKQLGVRSLDRPRQSEEVKKETLGHRETINSTHYDVHYVNVPIPDASDLFKEGASIVLWDENARFGAAAPNKKWSQEQLFNVLKENKDVQQLADAMLQNGGPCLDTPPVGVPYGDKYEVIEGNMRIVAAILCKQQDPVNFKEIPLKVYNGLSKADALILLGAIVRGKTPWGSEKDARLHMEAIRASGLEINQYARQQRLNPTRLKVTLAAYLGFHYFTTNYKIDRPKLFTYFAKFFAIPKFREKCGMQPVGKNGKTRRGKAAEFDWKKAAQSEFFYEFCEWIADGKIADCVQITDLPKVLEDAACHAKFLQKGMTFEDAWMLYGATHPEFTSEIYCDLISLTDLLKNAKEDEVDAVSGGDPYKIKIWRGFIEAVADYEGKIGCKIGELEPEEADIQL